MLVGRSGECGRLRELLAGAREGRAGVLVLRGESGIGKTRLLGFAVDIADGFQVVHAQGHESEMEIAFAGLSWVLDPLLSLLPRLSSGQADALAGALQIGPVAGGDRLAVAAATLTLLAAAADERPLLVAIDDAHWLDLPSLEAIVFAARRLEAERVAVLLTARPPEDTPRDASLRLEALPELIVAGLDPDAARALLTARGIRLAPDLMARRLAESGGNPLALLELQPLGGDGLPVAPLRIGRRLEQAFGRRVAAVPPPTRQAMLLLAAAGTAAGDVMGEALGRQGLSGADLEPAETAGLLTADRGTIRFRHPLVRSAVYQSASPTERRAAHRTLADVFGSLSTPRASERHAWHLAAATIGPDEDVAAALAAAAEAAAARRSYATAMDIYERAAALSPPGSSRARRLLQAADLSQQAGRIDAALPLLDRVMEETDDWRMQTEAQHLRCRIEMWGGRPVAARDLLLAEADRIEAMEPVWSGIMRTHAAMASVMLGDQQLASATAQRAVGLFTDLPESVKWPALVVHALVLATGGDAEEAGSILTRCEPYLEESDPLASDLPLLIAALGWASLEQPTEELRWLNRAIRSAHAASAAGPLPFLLSWLALAEWRGGHWAAAYSHASDAVALAEETAWRTEVPNSLLALATVEACLGHAGDCRAHTARAVALAEPTGAEIFAVRAATCLALLELGNSNNLEAARHLGLVAAFTSQHGLGDPVLLSWAADLVEAWVRAGEPDRARAAFDVLAVEAARTRRPTELALAARCRGLLASAGHDQEKAFAEALEWHGRAAQPFDEARTRLHHGELLRRHRRRADARAEFSVALGLFERLGAEPWVARTQSEMRATGVTVRPRRAPGPQQLTPQELRVALVVAEGATNVEAAGQLFLSAKTVEYHLSSIYRKFGIRSRGQLVRVLTDTSELDPSSGLSPWGPRAPA